MRLSLARHAEAEKNLLGSHGGNGTALTPLGRRQAARLAEECSSISCILYTERTQCRETAEILSQRLGVPARREHRVRPIGLGVADGLTQAELRVHYPSVASRMEKWRNGELEICDLAIPGGEDPVEYFEHGLRFLSDLSSGEIEDCLLVGTRSVLVLLWNILIGHNVYPGGGYREIPWKNATIRSGSWPRASDS